MLQHPLLYTAGILGPDTEVGHAIRNVLIATLNQLRNLADGNRFAYMRVINRLSSGDG